MGMPSKEEREAETMLRESGLPYELRHGRKHIAVYIRGERVMSISHGGAGRDTGKLRSILRRAQAVR